MESDQSNCFFHSGRSIADRNDKIIAKAHPGTPDACSRAGQSSGLREKSCFLIMNETTRLDSQTIQECSPQTALHHCDVGNNPRAPRQSHDPGSNGSRGNKHLINNIEITARMN
jgi:hypothetical protein